ncbi:hypothetical protein D7X33_19205 [Butyricicoccus sp. 1XD8-22]|nr:hypothetical protein D7X33_19205 [Butyricicoccus sp. 1XD8-22]
MENEHSGQYAQSVTIHHYEKWMDVNFIHQIASTFERMLNDNLDEESKGVLKKISLELIKQANSHIVDLTIQQHATTNFSLAENTLRNCLMYTLSSNVQQLNRVFEDELSDWEQRQIFTVTLPNLAAALQMLYERENKLPCILHTKNLREKFTKAFGELF